MDIAKHGYWIGHDPKEHRFDMHLTDAIIRMIKRRGYDSVIDVGCGNGSYASYINNAGIQCYGFDGNPDTEKITKGNCMVADFAVPVSVDPANLVLCLEVGEHIPAEYEDVFVKNIIEHAEKMLILSWAIEGQGGCGHVNCHDNEYVIPKIEDSGLKYSFNDSTYLRMYSSVNWFKNTLMVFYK